MGDSVKNKIKNLTVNNLNFYRVVCYGGAVLLPLGLFKAVGSVPFVKNKEKVYLETITTIDGNGNISYEEKYRLNEDLDRDKTVISITDEWMQDDDGKFYYQTTKEYEVDETFYSLLHYAKEDPSVLEELLNNPTNTKTIKKEVLTDSEINESKKAIVQIYEQDKSKYEYGTQSDITAFYCSLGYLVIQGLSLVAAAGCVYDKKKELVKSKNGGEGK